MPAIPVNKAVDKKIIIGKRRAEEAKRFKGSLTQKITKDKQINTLYIILKCQLSCYGLVSLLATMDAE
jgi:hypothetical protein